METSQQNKEGYDRYQHAAKSTFKLILKELREGNSKNEGRCSNKDISKGCCHASYGMVDFEFGLQPSSFVWQSLQLFELCCSTGVKGLE